MPKASNFTSGGVQNRDTKNRRLGTIVTSIQDSKPREKQISQSFSYCELINLLRNDTIVRCLWENKKTSEKSVFREVWSPVLTSQSFPVPCFWSRGLVPHRKWNLMLLVHQNTGKENRYGKNFFAVLISTLGRFDRANKKICHIHFKVDGTSFQVFWLCKLWKEITKRQSNMYDSIARFVLVQKRQLFCHQLLPW